MERARKYTYLSDSNDILYSYSRRVAVLLMRRDGYTYHYYYNNARYLKLSRFFPPFLFFRPRRYERRTRKTRYVYTRFFLLLRSRS